MDPFTIATAVAKCVNTGKAIYDLTSKLQDAPRYIVAISSETKVISSSLSQIQALVLSGNISEQGRLRPEIASTLDTCLTGFMVLFSCIDEELREVLRYSRGRNGLSWLGKTKTVWKEETFRELLDNIRGQELAINTLIQLLRLRSSAEIAPLLQRDALQFKKVDERTKSLRKSHPSVREKIAGSIFNEVDQMSDRAAPGSVVTPSNLEFEFDEIVVNSTPYQRVLAADERTSPVVNSTPYQRDLAADERASSVSRVTKVDGDAVELANRTTLEQTAAKQRISDSTTKLQRSRGRDFVMKIADCVFNTDMCIFFLCCIP